MGEEPPKSEKDKPSESEQSRPEVETKRVVITPNPNLKTAVLVAVEFLRDLDKAGVLGGQSTTSCLKGCAVEIWERAVIGRSCLVIGSPPPFKELFEGGPFGAIKPVHSQVFKEITVNRRTGQVTSMAPYETPGR